MTQEHVKLPIWDSVDYIVCKGALFNYSDLARTQTQLYTLLRLSEKANSVRPVEA